jgi:hypothetical protein
MEAVSTERGARELALGPACRLVEDQEDADASPKKGERRGSCSDRTHPRLGLGGGCSRRVGPLVRKEDTLGLYERLLQEATQEAEENPQREEQRRRQTHKRQKMQAYIKRRRMPVAGGGGYVTSEEIREEQERHLADLQALYGLVSGGG